MPPDWFSLSKLFAVLTTCLALPTLASTTAAQSPTRPNLLLIVPDDLGVDSVGCYGTGNAPPTPVLDLVAQGGLRFTRFFVNPACSPTRAAILTGRHAFRGECPAALPPGALGLTANSLMLPAALNEVGYATAMIGKWHMGNRYGAMTPGAYGWGHFEGILDSGVPDPFQWSKITNGLTAPCSNYIMSDQVDSAINWIQGRTGPWAMALTLTLPHVPFHAPPAHLHTQNLAGLHPSTTPRPFFSAMVQAMDTEIGRLLATLGPAVLANTNIVIVADNGTDGAVVLPPLSASRAKGSLYDGGANVPLIVHGPAVANPGTTATELLSGVDLFPTLLGMCGVTFPSANLAPFAAPLDGTSFQSALAGQTGYGRTHLYSEISASPYGEGYTLRTNTHRLIRYMQNQPQHQEFYNLANDPAEQNDLLLTQMTVADATAFHLVTAVLETIRSDGWGELYGIGCASSVGVPLLRWQSQPRVGGQFWAYMSNLSPTATSFLGMLGASRTAWNGQPLPMDLGGVGMPGCALNVSIDATVPFSANGYMFAFEIPAVPALYQLEFFLQGLVWDPAANPTGLVTSRGLRLVTGL